MSTETNSPSLIVVTGASTGIGAATARELASRGFIVLAGVRRVEDGDAIRAPGIEPVLLDITDETQVTALAERVAAAPQPLRALVNNAGISINAPVESLPLDEWRRQFEVNLFGQIAMTQALLPALIASRGTIVNISSIGGKVALPTYGAYAGSKFALEAASDALRREIADLGVNVVIVEPGAVVTRIAERGVATSERIAQEMPPVQTERYDSMFRAVLAQAESFGRDGVPAEEAADVIAKAIEADRPRLRYTVGRDAAVMSRLVRLLPDRMLDRAVARELRRHSV